MLKLTLNQTDIDLVSSLNATNDRIEKLINAALDEGRENLKGDLKFHAFSWTQGQKRDLGTLDGDGCSYALVNNSHREVVGISGDCAFQSARGFYIKGDGPMVDIDSLIVRGPLVTPLQPVYISEKGEIVEWAAFPNGEFRTSCSDPRTTERGTVKITIRRCHRESVPRLLQKSEAVRGACAALGTCQNTTSRSLC